MPGYKLSTLYLDSLSERNTILCRCPGISARVHSVNIALVSVIKVFLNFWQIPLGVSSPHSKIITKSESRKLLHWRHTFRLRCLATLPQYSPGLFVPVPWRFYCFSGSAVVLEAAASRLQPAVRKTKSNVGNLMNSCDAERLVHTFQLCHWWSITIFPIWILLTFPFSVYRYQFYIYLRKLLFQWFL